MPDTKMSTTAAHQPITPGGWELVFSVLENTKLDVPRIRAEVARLQAALAQQAVPQAGGLSDHMALVAAVRMAVTKQCMAPSQENVAKVDAATAAVEASARAILARAGAVEGGR